MSWLWGSSDADKDPDAGTEALPSEQLSYSGAFVPDAVHSTGPENDLGSAFSDTDAFAAPASDSFFPAASSDPSASFMPPPMNPPGVGGPRVNFDAMGSISAGTVAPAFGMYNLPSSGGVDYVFSDDYAEIRKKGVGEQLVYYTGSAYLSGAFIGGGVGLTQGLRESAGKASKLRLNAVLNAVGKRGVAASNSLAVLALMFSLSEAAVYHYTSDDTAVNYAAAGAATGAIFKCTRGVRVAGVWAAAGAATALATVYASRNGTYGRGLQGLL